MQSDNGHRGTVGRVEKRKYVNDPSRLVVIIYLFLTAVVTVGKRKTKEISTGRLRFVHNSLQDWIKQIC